MKREKVPKVPVSFRLRPDTRVRADKFAKDEHRTLSNVVQMAVREFLDRPCRVGKTHKEKPNE